VPAVVTLMEVPVTVQPVAVPLTALKVTAPAPDPPFATRVKATPTTPAMGVTVIAPVRRR